MKGQIGESRKYNTRCAPRKNMRVPIHANVNAHGLAHTLQFYATINVANRPKNMRRRILIIQIMGQKRGAYRPKGCPRAGESRK